MILNCLNADVAETRGFLLCATTLVERASGGNYCVDAEKTVKPETAGFGGARGNDGGDGSRFFSSLMGLDRTWSLVRSDQVG